MERWREDIYQKGKIYVSARSIFKRYRDIWCIQETPKLLDVM